LPAAEAAAAEATASALTSTLKRVFSAL